MEVVLSDERRARVSKRLARNCNFLKVAVEHGAGDDDEPMPLAGVRPEGLKALEWFFSCITDDRLQLIEEYQAQSKQMDIFGRGPLSPNGKEDTWARMGLRNLTSEQIITISRASDYLDCSAVNTMLAFRVAWDLAMMDDDTFESAWGPLQESVGDNWEFE